MLIRTNKFELEVMPRMLFIKAFKYECFVGALDYSSWSYFKDSTQEREVHLGRVKVLVSKVIH